MTEIQIPQTESQILGATDSYYKFLKEKRKREQEGGDVDSLLSQELALVKDNVVIADLNLLRAQGTFSEEERNVPKDQAQYEHVLSLQSLQGNEDMYSLKDTDWSEIDKFIVKYFQESSSIIKELDIESLKNLDPAVAATLAYEITKHFMVLDEEMEKNRAGEKAVAANARSADALLRERHGICRHFTKVAIAIYDRLKQIDETGSLTDTVLLPVGNTLKDDVHGPHAYCLLIAQREETVLSIGDPTLFKSMDIEVHSDLRLASLVSTLIEKNLLTALDIKEETLLVLIDEELSRLDKWASFKKRLKTNNLYQKEFLNNEDAAREQGFDERATHFFTENASILQLVYALNTAKSMLRNPDYGGVVTQENMEIGSQAIYDWVIQKSEQLTPRATISGISKILDIAPPGVITLELLTSIISTLAELPLPTNEQAKLVLQDKLQARINQLMRQTILVSSDDPWAEIARERKYSEEQIAEIQDLLNNLY